MHRTRRPPCQAELSSPRVMHSLKKCDGETGAAWRVRERAGKLLIRVVRLCLQSSPPQVARGACVYVRTLCVHTSCRD